MPDFLLELRSEEIPARMQPKAREDLARLFTTELTKAGLAAAELVTYATPRRLVLIARDLPLETAAVSEEIKGPKSSAPPQALEGFLRKTGLTRDQLVERDGILFAVIDKPGRATADVLAEAIPAIVRAFPWPKSMRWGAASASTESLRWVRPLQGIVALLGEEIVPFEIAGISSGAATVGHRFHHPGVITIGSAADYVEKLRACHVIVDQDERQSIIALGATMAAGKAGLTLVRDEGLLVENAGLTELPMALLGRFDEAYLSVPPEVIQLTARVNQKYFVCHDADGKLANAFICTANIDAEDGGATIVEGNRKVLAARLSDAKFFYETDLKVPLDEQAKKLSQIVFHEKLGTVADKVDRVAKLARWLVEEGIVTSPSPISGEGQPGAARQGEGQSEDAGAPDPSPSAAGATYPSPARGEGLPLATLAERAARLCKADLVTGMVGEFPELQGIMGGYYARAQGEDPQVADAIRDHYKPVGQGDQVPIAPVTVAVSLADKLDTIASFFTIDERPTGSKDPFALRRSALAVLSLLQENQIRLPVFPVLLRHTCRLFWSEYQRIQQLEIRARTTALKQRTREALAAACVTVWPDRFGEETDDPNVIVELMEATQKVALNYFNFKRAAELDGFGASAIVAVEPVLEFFADRLKVQQREAGVRHDLIDAVFALGGEDDLVRLLARVKALQAFVATEDGANLLAGYKRAANILKKSPSPISGEGQASEARQGEGSGLGAPGPSPSAADAAFPSPARGEGQKALSYKPEISEAALIAALDSAEPRAAIAIEAEDFEGAMTALATLRAPIDAFFDSVTVNDPDPDKRAARLALLARVRDAVHRVADFSRIEG